MDLSDPCQRLKVVREQIKEVQSELDRLKEREAELAKRCQASKKRRDI